MEREFSFKLFIFPDFEVDLYFIYFLDSVLFLQFDLYRMQFEDFANHNAFDLLAKYGFSL